MTIKYSLVKSTDDLDWVTHAVATALKDSPFRELMPNMELLKETVTRFCVDTSNVTKFAMIATVDEEIVGIVAASTLEDHFIFSDNKAGQEILWWVHPEHRKTGISKELMECLDTWAEHNKLKHLFLSHYHNEYTTDMKKLYKSWGYKPVEYTYWKEME